METIFWFAWSCVKAYCLATLLAQRPKAIPMGLDEHHEQDWQKPSTGEFHFNLSRLRNLELLQSDANVLLILSNEAQNNRSNSAEHSGA
uniref:Putative secreted protein n=1 Tax=Anopheles darlingi TaxID=43151 RepID=A0A2M4DPX8_ANODA